jgi:signal-transduction protein with cAMP-binding, CBS, and nucleotidyltransferase domain
MICPTCGYDNVPGNESCSYCKQDLTPFDRPVATCKVERSLMEDQVNVLGFNAPSIVPHTTTLRQAIDAMAERNVGALLVVDGRGVLQGIISERDLLKKVAGRDDDCDDLPVTQFMTPRPESVSPTATLSYVLNKMDGGGYRHVPIVQAGQPIGVLSVRDMLRHLTRLCT